MLFKTIDELKELTGFLYAYNSFDNIRTDIELATEELASLIGEEIMAVAENHYNSEDWGSEEFEVLNSLVKHIQLPVAFHAIHSFSQNTDVSHEDSGRKVKIDVEREKLPWEWMLEKDEKAILKKAYRTTDRLLAFLEKNIEVLTEWADSAARAAIRNQFINSASAFNEIYPIGSDRRFFMVISPFIREAERKYIKPVLTPAVYDELKASLATPPDPEIPVDPDPDGLLPYIRIPLALFSMSIAVDRLAIEVLPEGVYQNLVSDRLTQNAKQPALTEVRREASKILLDKANAELRLLQEHIRKLKVEEGDAFIEADLTSGLTEDNLFARV